MPIETWRIRHHAQPISVNFELSVDKFQNHAVAAGVVQDVVDRRDETHVFLDGCAHAHVLDGSHGFLHIGAGAE